MSDDEREFQDDEREFQEWWQQTVAKADAIIAAHWHGESVPQSVRLIVAHAYTQGVIDELRNATDELEAKTASLRAQLKEWEI